MKEDIQYRLRRINKKDIPVLYELLKESLSEEFTSVYDTKLPSFKKSEKFVLDFLEINKTQLQKNKTEKIRSKKQRIHEFDKWYVILDKKNQITGQVFITKNNFLGYTVFKKFQDRGIAVKGIKLIMKLHPRKKYFVMIHHKNEKSKHIANKLGFNLKGYVLEKN